MAYCSSCNGNVHRTTKICPHCGGDFEALFGPSREWGTAPTPEQIKQAKEDYENAPIWLKMLTGLMGGLIIYFFQWLF